MKKIRFNREITLFVILIFLGLGIAPGITNTAADDKKIQETETLTFIQEFSLPILKYDDEFVDITVDQTNFILPSEGKPMIPLLSKTFEFPLGTKITDISIKHSEIQNFVLEKKISPVPNKQKLGFDINIIENSLNEEIYNSNNPYPTTWFSYYTGAGLDKDNNHVLILTVHIYPTRYISSENILQFIELLELNVIYTKPSNSIIFNNMYDLVIITPQEFSSNLQRLADHKNSNGVETKIVTTESIYDEYFGRDEPEKIKYFIKYALEQWDIKYVLLVGNVKKLPIRITYANWWEPDILCDLYYSDVYDSSNNFCSWDSNGNNLFGEVTDDGYDIDGVDLFADVHIGRIPCTDNIELDTVINKIIKYENEAYVSNWFKKIILVGGDTFPPINHHSERDVFEGEITNAHVAQTLPEFESVLLWASKRNLNALTFNMAVNRGAGFLSYAGHGFEHGWGTYRPNAMINRMIFYFSPYVKLIKNHDKLPIIFFDACLTAKLDFNIADLDEYMGNLVTLVVRFTKVEYDISIHYPCVAWVFLKHERGGSIATIGSTRTAYTWVNEYGVFGGAGYLDVSFHKAYEEGVTAGEMLTTAQSDYINFVGRDYFTIEEFVLLGDPSLRVGGYQS